MGSGAGGLLGRLEGYALVLLTRRRSGSNRLRRLQRLHLTAYRSNGKCVLKADVWAWSRAYGSGMEAEDRNVDGNSRLTALLGATVLPLFIAAWLLGKAGGTSLVTAHIVVSLVLAAPLVAKLSSVTYRMASYYRGVRAYRHRGRPANHLRLLGGVLGVSVLTLLGSGLVLLLGPASVYETAKSVHSVAAWLALVAVLVHLAAHARETRRLVSAEMRSAALRPAGLGRRLATVATALLCGAILAAVLFEPATHLHQQHQVRAGSAMPALPTRALNPSVSPLRK